MVETKPPLKRDPKLQDVVKEEELMLLQRPAWTMRTRVAVEVADHKLRASRQTLLKVTMRKSSKAQATVAEGTTTREVVARTNVSKTKTLGSTSTTTWRDQSTKR